MKHHCAMANAATFWKWLKTRGGLAVWGSVNMSNPGASWTTPALDSEGKATTKPNWQCSETPCRIITDPDEVTVAWDKEVKRFRVGVRMGSQGFMLKVTDGGTRRIRAAVEKAGEGAYHVFDYDTQEAVIMAPDKTMTLTEWSMTDEGGNARTALSLELGQPM